MSQTSYIALSITWATTLAGNLSALTLCLLHKGAHEGLAGFFPECLKGRTSISNFRLEDKQYD